MKIIKNKNLISFLNKFIFIFLFLFSILYSIESYSKEYFFIFDRIFLISTAICYLFSLLLFVFYCEINSELKLKFLLIFLILLSLFISFVIKSFKNGGIIAIPLVLFSYVYHFVILNSNIRKFTYFNKKKFITIFFIIIIIFSLLPIILFLITKSEYFLGQYDQTFKGFSTNRNAFSYMAGIFIIISLIERRKVFYLTSFLLLFGILLAESRAVLISLFSVIFVYYFQFQNSILKKIFFSAIFFIVLFFVYDFYKSITIRDFQYADVGRVFLVEDYVQFIKQNLFFGNGGDLYFEYYNNAAGKYELFNSHNFILHITSGYGLVTFFLYSILIIYHIYKLNFYSRLFWIYIYIIGIFQPTVGLGFTSLHLLISLFSFLYNTPLNIYSTDSDTISTH